MTTVITLPKLQPWQKELYDAVAPAAGTGHIFCCKSKRQVGKSIVAVCLLIKYCLEKKCISVCVEPTQAQSRRVYKQLCDFLDGSGAIASANSTLLIIGFTNGSELLFKSAEQREALRGYSVSGLMVIDEGATIPKDIYEILWATCDANSAPVLVISTPLFCSGEFYELYMRGKEGNDRVTSFDWSTYDTSIFLTPEKLEYYRKTVSPLKFKSEYLGEFISEGSYVMGNLTPCIKTFSTKPAKYGGIDWGTGDGGDYTVLVLMDEDGAVTDIWSARDKEATVQVDILAGIINNQPQLKTVSVEQNSIGQVFYDLLKNKVKKSIKKFLTSNESKRRIVEQLIEAFQTEAITIPYDEELIKELQHYNIEKTGKGYTYNGADGVNDDYCIALALAYDTYKHSFNSLAISFA